MLLDEFATYREITSQTAAWAQALDLIKASSFPSAKDYDQVIFTGCGSTYYLSLAAAALYQELTGLDARAIPAGELLLNTQTSISRVLNSTYKRLLVAVSRSGTTTETLRAVEKFKTNKLGDVIAISNYEKALSQLADFSIVISNGQEESVAQTRSFSSMYTAVAGFSARMASRGDLLDCLFSLPAVGRRLIQDFEPTARQSGENLHSDRFYFLGSGIRYGLACEANLKMKEMALTHTEPFHFLEFRHGPMSMVNEKTVVVGLLSDSNRKHEKAVLSEMKALGGKILTLAECDADISFQSQIPEPGREVLYLPILQLMAFYRALSKGLNPDRPQNLAAVIELNL